MVEQVVVEVMWIYLCDVVLYYSEIIVEDCQCVEQCCCILNDEFNYCVKNIIVLVKLIVLQIGVYVVMVEEYLILLEGWLRVFVFVYDQLLVGISGDLIMLLEVEVSLYCYGLVFDCVVIVGQFVGFDDWIFGVMVLVVYELMINVVKYGVLLIVEGKLLIVWDLLLVGDCWIIWCESGGLLVKKLLWIGFGSKLVYIMMFYDLGGLIVIDFVEIGLVVMLMILVGYIIDVLLQLLVLFVVEVMVDMFVGFDVLLVEDQVLIVMDIEDMLMWLGVCWV